MKVRINSGEMDIDFVDKNKFTISDALEVLNGKSVEDIKRRKTIRNSGSVTQQDVDTLNPRMRMPI